jgi:hypothetical protein
VKIVADENVYDPIVDFLIREGHALLPLDFSRALPSIANDMDRAISVVTADCGCIDSHRTSRRRAPASDMRRLTLPAASRCSAFKGDTHADSF